MLRLTWHFTLHFLRTMVRPSSPQVSLEAHQLYVKESTATRAEPWIFRTYGGHSNARATNELYRTGLARGKTGLSIAFDLATQCGYDSDHPMARPEVGKVGVPLN